MAVNLANLEPHRITRNLKGKLVLLYGNAKIGKTTLISKFDNILILAFECGYNALNNVYVQPIKTWEDFLSAIRQLKTKAIKEKFEMIGVDTVDSAYDLCVKYICDKYDVEKLGDLAYGQGYEYVKNEFSKAFRDLAFEGYGLAFVSHSGEKTFKDENGKEYIQISPSLPNRPYNIINKLVDIIGYIREVEEDNNGVKSSKRYLYLRGNRSFLAGSRYKYIKPRVELSYKQLVNAIYEAIDEEIKNSGGEASTEENSFYQKTFEDYMEESKQLWVEATENGRIDEIKKILQDVFGKPTKFSEITPSEIDSLKKVVETIRNL